MTAATTVSTQAVTPTDSASGSGVQASSQWNLPTIFDEPDRRPVLTAGDVLLDPARNEFSWLTQADGELIECGLSRGEVGDSGHRPVAGSGLEWDVSEGRVARVGTGARTLPAAHLVKHAHSGTAYDRGTLRQAAGVGSYHVDDLSLRRLRDQGRANRFLDHPIIDHTRGSINGWRACFALEHRGDLVAVLVLENPYNPVRDDGAEIYISRYAAHPFRPSNTASHLIAHARNWAKLEGFTLLSTNAGVANDNFGTIYDGAGFTYLETTHADGSGWQDSRSGGRDSWDDYARRRHRFQIGEPGLRRYTPKTAKFTEPSTSLDAFQAESAPRKANSSLIRIELPEGQDDADVEMLARFGLWDGHYGSMLESVESEAVFAGEHASTLRGIIVCDADDGETLRLQTVDVNDAKWPTNYGAWLVGRVREWARYEGYQRLAARARPDSQANRILTRAGLSG